MNSVIMRACHRNFHAIHSAVIIFPEPGDPHNPVNYVVIYVTADIVKREAFVLLSAARQHRERGFSRG